MGLWRHTYTSNVVMDARAHLVRFINLRADHPRKRKWKPTRKIDQGADLQKAKSDAGTPYPHEFHVTDHTRSPQVMAVLSADSDCRLGQPGTTYLEYPMSDNNNVRPYTGHSPGADRIIVMVRGTQIGQYSNPVYCLSMTHESRTSRPMIPCPTDMSPQA